MTRASMTVSIPLAALVASRCPAAAAGEEPAGGPPPNIVLILTDDLGDGDLGCFGSRSNRTPLLDRLAREGLLLTDFHSNGPMCSATRAALLTGRSQNRLGPAFEGALDEDRDQGLGLPPEAATIAEDLGRLGYATGLFGNWHLGDRAPFLPTRQGFGEFAGLLTGDGDHHAHSTWPATPPLPRPTRSCRGSRSGSADRGLEATRGGRRPLPSTPVRNGPEEPEVMV